MKTNTIKPDPDQPRKTFDKVEMMELKASVKEHGVLQPILVDEDNTIIDGERRWRAAKELGIKDVPVVKLETVEERLAYQCVVDVQHKNVPILERDKAWLQLYESMGYPTKREFSKVLGVSHHTASDALERARYVPKVAVPTENLHGDVFTETKSIKDDEVRAKAIEKASEIGDSRQKRSYLSRVKQAIDEGNVEEVLAEDVTDYSKKADAVLHNMNQVVKNLQPGLMLKLPKTQALILSSKIVQLKDHLKKWDESGVVVEDAELV